MSRKALFYAAFGVFKYSILLFSLYRLNNKRLSEKIYSTIITK